MEEKNKHIRYYILFDNHTQGMMLHELLDKQGLPNRIAPARVTLMAKLPAEWRFGSIRMTLMPSEHASKRIMPNM